MSSRDRLAWWGSQVLQICRDSLPLILPFLLLNVLGHFATMAATVVGTSLFLSNIGSAQLPFALLYSTLFSLVVAPLLTWGLVRTSLRTVMIGFYASLGLLAALLWFTFQFEPRAASWGAFILGECALPLELALFWGIFSHYFTLIDVKRFTSILSVTAGVGGMIGSALVGLMALWLPSEVGLLLVGGGGLGAIVMLFYVGLLREPLRPAPSPPLPQYRGFWGRLMLLARLQRFYPIVIFVLLGAFLTRALDTIMKVEALDAIASLLAASEQKLTGFIGGVYAIANFSLFGTVAVARPVIRRLGVTRVNVVYPLITFAALALLLLTDRSLIAAALLLLNYLVLVPALHRLIFNLNVIAVPARYTGQVRLLMLGVFGPLGLMAGAGGIIAVQWHLSSDEMLTWAVILAALTVVVGYFTGRAYARSLVSGMRRGAIRLASDEHTQLPSDQQGEIEAMLEADSPQVRRSGALLAARLVDPSAVLEPVLAAAEGDVLVAYLRHLPAATLASLKERPEGAAALATKGGVEAPDLTPAAQQLAVRALASDPDVAAKPLLLELVRHPSLRAGALSALAGCAQSGDPFSSLAAEAMDDGDPGVRAGGIQLAHALLAPSLVSRIGHALEDADPRVRECAAQALPDFGDAGFAQAAARLSHRKEEVLSAALLATGRFPGKRAQRALYNALQPSLEAVRMYGRLPSLLRIGTDEWRFVSLAVQDHTHRVANLIGDALSAIGHADTIERIRHAVVGGDLHQRASALETFANLRPRRFVQPILAVLEKELTQSPRSEPALVRDNQAAVSRLQEGLAALMASSDPYVRAGAHLTWSKVWPEQEPPQAHPDHLQDFEPLFFLPEVSLLNGQPLARLEELLKKVAVEHIPAGESIENPGDRLFIIHEGAVQLGRRQLRRGEYFGEQALFDPRPQTARAITPCELWILHPQIDETWARENPAILLQVAKDLCVQLRSTS